MKVIGTEEKGFGPVTGADMISVSAELISSASGEPCGMSTHSMTKTHRSAASRLSRSLFRALMLLVSLFSIVLLLTGSGAIGYMLQRVFSQFNS